MTVSLPEGVEWRFGMTEVTMGSFENLMRMRKHMG